MALRRTPEILVLALVCGASLSAHPQAPAQPQAATAASQAPSPQGLTPEQTKKIADLKIRADHTKDPRQKHDYCQQIFDINPDDPFANKCKEETNAELKQQDDAAKARQANEQEKNQDLTRAKQAFAAGSIGSALDALSMARKKDPNDPEIDRLEKRFQQANQVEKARQYIWAGGGIAAVAGLIGLLVLKRGKREAYLEVVDGPNQGRRYPLPKDQEAVLIGSVDEYGGVRNHIVLSDPDRTISRFHCRVLRVGRKLYLLDKESVNGTWVDRTRLHHGTPVRLRNGARIGLAGVCVLRLGFERKQA